MMSLLQPVYTVLAHTPSTAHSVHQLFHRRTCTDAKHTKSSALECLKSISALSGDTVTAPSTTGAPTAAGSQKTSYFSSASYASTGASTSVTQRVAYPTPALGASKPVLDLAGSISPSLLTQGRTVSSVEEGSTLSVIPLQRFPAVHDQDLQVVHGDHSSSPLSVGFQASEPEAVPASSSDHTVRRHSSPTDSSHCHTHPTVKPRLVRPRRTSRGAQRPCVKTYRRTSPSASPQSDDESYFRRLPILMSVANHTPRPFLTVDTTQLEFGSSFLAQNSDEPHTPEARFFGFSSPESWKGNNHCHSVPSGMGGLTTTSSGHSTRSWNCPASMPSSSSSDEEDTPLYLTIFDMRGRPSDEELAVRLLQDASVYHSNPKFSLYSAFDDQYKVW
ncbi:hypothetical protein IWQ62_004871 [Dispira parvispora]|uniref:Uncharacterized protein n=1 Tax=Dispira parvispora TaxID=1520584 RepID=A0A9W8AKT3_9FUNG|nr:hypothetical protein IWQ62_004871 [Dispira parvispora]